ncbi:MAG TPA: SGNH/GDSL hydrolase family protein [Pyrinomonadaceae bacterium]|jgi:lysophospholipase L1-like esterase|nr:SGNH/GDSL hydrolase family protein [Pyrinomonadaceae bacterium]
MNLILWQTIYVLGGIMILPFAPFLYLQSRFVRRKVGRLPDAAGAAEGKFENGAESVKLLVLGESTAAGVGARTHETALAGQFARLLGEKIGKSVEWQVVGRSGITVKETIHELVPKIPDEEFDYIMLALCGNEVLKLRSPRTFRRDMRNLIAILQEKNADATFFLTNAPAVRLSPVLPFPIKFVLGHLSALHDANAREFTAEMRRVFYFHQPTSVPEDFWADGIHPSEKGYTAWSKRMIEFFEEKYDW